MESPDNTAVKNTGPAESALLGRDELQSIQDTFAAAVGASTAIVSASGTGLTKISGMCRVCYLIRTTDKGNTDCQVFKRRLLERVLKHGKPVYQPCDRTGFAEACIPIVVNDTTVGAWLMGQVKVSTGERDRLRAYAEAIGADADSVTAAYDSMPRRPLERYLKAVDLLSRLSPLTAAGTETATDTASGARDDDREHREATVAELEKTKAELEEFAYIVSHDLKAPLRAVSQLAGWLKQDHAESLSDDGKEMIDLLTGRLDRMGALLEGVLQYSRAGRIREKEKDTDLNEIVNEVIQKIDPPDTIEIRTAKSLPVVRAEPGRIAVVLEALLDNAVKFMDKPDGEVTVDYSDAGSHWEFSITDNGPGVDEDHHERIFKIFQTGAARDEFESTGMGLTVAKKIVESRGGAIRIESQKGEGCRFLFTIKKTGAAS